jgi:hypothetical protein
MANYMTATLHISEFKNTNIVGDGVMWEYQIVNWAVVNCTNVGLIGDYGSLTGFSGSFNGVIDITGSLPETMGQGTRNGYLNVWGTVSRETGIDRFNVVRVHGLGGEKIITGYIEDDTIADRIIIFSKKYNSSNAVASIPHHRAFMVNGTPKITGSDITSNAAYLGSDSNKPIPELDESVWVNANGATPPNLAANYAGLSAAYKFASAGEFDSLP